MKYLLSLAAMLILHMMPGGEAIAVVNAAPDLSIPALTVDAAEGESRSYSLSVVILLMMTALTLLPALLLSMTAFTRIIIVLAIVRQAIGTPQTPPNQILIGLSLFMTFFVMAPVTGEAYRAGVTPYLAGEMQIQEALDASLQPMRTFMLEQTREADLQRFGEIAGYAHIDSVDDIPLSLILPAFVTSELKTAFQIGFIVFIPFLIIDLAVASVLMSMGMMMLSPMLISLPFKILLFVMVDGWSLLMGALASSFYI